MSGGPQWYWILSAATALGLVLIGLYKLRPESTKIFVESAEVSVRMSDARAALLATEAAALDARVTALEQAAEADRRWRHLAVAYIRTLLNTLDEHRITPPPPPEGLDL